LNSNKNPSYSSAQGFYQQSLTLLEKPKNLLLIQQKQNFFLKWQHRILKLNKDWLWTILSNKKLNSKIHLITLVWWKLLRFHIEADQYANLNLNQINVKLNKIIKLFLTIFYFSEALNNHIIIEEYPNH